MHSVKDIMTSQCVIVYPDDRADRALTLMLRHHVSGLPVVDSNNHLIGVISEFDLLQMIDDVSVEEGFVSDYMTPQPLTIDVNAPVIEAADLFREKGVRRLPVTDLGKLVGVISRRDLIRYVREVRVKVAAVLEAQKAEGSHA